MIIGLLDYSGALKSIKAKGGQRSNQSQTCNFRDTVDRILMMIYLAQN